MQNRPQDALPDCHAALEADETYRRALERAASCHRRMGDLKMAEEVLAQAVAASATASHTTGDDRAALISRLAEVRQLREEVCCLLYRGRHAWPSCMEVNGCTCTYAISSQHKLSPPFLCCSPV